MKQIFLTLVLMCVFVSGALAAEQQITFAWNQEISADFAGWKLYQADTSGGPYSLAAEIPYSGEQSEYQSQQMLSAQDGAETKLYFVLTAFDSNGNESGYSNETDHTFDFLSPGTPFSLRILVVGQ